MSRQTGAAGKFIYWCLSFISVLFHTDSFLISLFLIFRKVNFLTPIYRSIIKFYVRVFIRPCNASRKPFNPYFYNNNMLNNFNSRGKSQFTYKHRSTRLNYGHTGWHAILWKEREKTWFIEFIYIPYNKQYHLSIITINMIANISVMFISLMVLLAIGE